ncbi:MAG: cytochrome b/b6 domain-containing protein [bacterium]|nr:cytochrome b/b6 domain-containing protein [bacterium]
MAKMYLFTVFERLWHWFQVIVVTVLLLTGFSIHASINLMPFADAVRIHNIAGLAWAVGTPFFLFWLVITGQWKHYIPTTKKFFAVARYYAWDIFWSTDHPFVKTETEKHNPIQRLAYLSLFLFIAPVQIISGVIYWQWHNLGLGFLGLRNLAFVHILFAFAILGFVLVHVYMITTGKTLLSYIRGMIHGFVE